MRFRFRGSRKKKWWNRFIILNWIPRFAFLISISARWRSRVFKLDAVWRRRSRSLDKLVRGSLFRLPGSLLGKCYASRLFSEGPNLTRLSPPLCGTDAVIANGNFSFRRASRWASARQVRLVVYLGPVKYTDSANIYARPQIFAERFCEVAVYARRQFLAPSNPFAFQSPISHRSIDRLERRMVRDDTVKRNVPTSSAWWCRRDNVGYSHWY